MPFEGTNTAAWRKWLAGAHCPWLTADQQRTVWLAAAGYKPVEIAKIMNVSLSTVYARLREAGHYIFDRLGVEWTEALLGAWYAADHDRCCCPEAERGG